MPDYISDTLYIYRSELQLISDCVLRNPEQETGGDLFGNWTHQACPVVQVAIGPGPNHKADRVSFYQDAEYLRDQGHYWMQAHALHHIGQWHSHHGLGLDSPSAHDDATVFNAIRKYGLNDFLLIIATLQDVVCLKAFLYRSNETRCGLRWNVLPADNPYNPKSDLDSVPMPRCIDSDVKRRSIELALSGKDLWLNTEDGRKWLFLLHESLKNQCRSVSMRKSEDGMIVIACKASDRTFEYHIPETYPNNPAYWRDIEAENTFTIPQHGQETLQNRVCYPGT